MSFEISTELIDLYEEGIDEIITTFGKSCRLYFPPALNECPNCKLDTLNNTSSNRYKAGGPISFSDGICPYCKGIGYINQDVTEDITMIVHDNPKNWLFVGRLIIPQGGIQTRGYMAAHYAKLQQTVRMRRKSLDGYDTFEYEKNEAPIPYGLRYKWVITNWKRV
jgi:hypothetical protein